MFRACRHSLISFLAGDMLDGMRPGSDTSDEMAATVEALKSSISTFMHNIHWLMGALDEVAKIHRFLAGMCTFGQEMGRWTLTWI